MWRRCGWGAGARMELEKPCIRATLDVVGPCGDFGPNPASSRVWYGSNLFTLVFCQILLSALLRMGWREIFEEALKQAKDGGDLAQGGGGYGEKKLKEYHCLFSI